MWGTAVVAVVVVATVAPDELPPFTLSSVVDEVSVECWSSSCVSPLVCGSPFSFPFPVPFPCFYDIPAAVSVAIVNEVLAGTLEALCSNALLALDSFLSVVVWTFAAFAPPADASGVIGLAWRLFENFFLRRFNAARAPK